MRSWHWLLLLAIAFVAGLASGKRWGEQGTELVLETGPEPAPKAASPAALGVAVPGFADAVANRDWEGLVELLEAARREGRDADHAALYAGMRRVAGDLIAAEAMPEAVDLLARFAELNPQDNGVKFQWAEALTAAGDYEGALKPVLAVLAAPLNAEEERQADELRTELVELEVDRLTANAIDAQRHAEPELGTRAAAESLIALYENLVRAEPLNDAHRLKLAEAYLAAGQPNAAAQTLDGVAGYGVEPEAVAALRDATNAAVTEPRFERRARSLLASAEVAGQTLNLLLDTGATQTALSPAALAQVGAEPLARSTRVNTAGGAIEAPLYRVQSFVFGGQRFEALEVIALAEVPRDTDGLLGMDVLGQMGALPLNP